MGLGRVQGSRASEKLAQHIPTFTERKATTGSGCLGLHSSSCGTTPVTFHMVIICPLSSDHSENWGQSSLSRCLGLKEIFKSLAFGGLLYFQLILGLETRSCINSVSLLPPPVYHVKCLIILGTERRDSFGSYAYDLQRKCNDILNWLIRGNHDSLACRS